MAIVMEDVQALEARHVLQTYRRQPTQATYLGIHKYDDKLED